jgi:hypothetical protein
LVAAIGVDSLPSTFGREPHTMLHAGSSFGLGWLARL